MLRAGNTWVPDGDVYFAHHFSESDIWTPQDLLKGLEFVTEWDCAIDGGAHVGSWSRYLARGFKHVYAFEPQQDNFNCLLSNIAGLDNIDPHRLALGDAYGKASMVAGTNTGGWHVGDGEGVTKIPLDDIWPLHGRKVGYLKLDVEGYEWYALNGARKILERCWPIVQIEEKTLPHTYSCPTARSLLEGLGYKEVAKSGRDVIFRKEA